jgi:hypothetical protein
LILDVSIAKEQAIIWIKIKDGQRRQQNLDINLSSNYLTDNFGLEKHIWILFRGEIQRNCDFALLAYYDIIKYSHSEHHNKKDRSDRIWLSIESFLNAVANVSKILWPSRPPKCNRCGFQSELPTKVFSRARDLRTFLSISNSSPLAIRQFRNFVEHYDFQLDDWVKQSNAELVYDSNVGPMKSVIKSSDKTISIIRHFDQSKSIIYYIEPVVKALQELKAKTEIISL